VNLSMVGKPTEALLFWPVWYIQCRKLQHLTADQLPREALLEQETYAWVTKSKIRRAVARFVDSGMGKKTKRPWPSLWQSSRHSLNKIRSSTRLGVRTRLFMFSETTHQPQDASPRLPAYC
jgi:hypothetical protein